MKITIATDERTCRVCEKKVSPVAFPVIWCPFICLCLKREIDSIRQRKSNCWFQSSCMLMRGQSALKIDLSSQSSSFSLCDQIACDLTHFLLTTHRIHHRDNVLQQNFYRLTIDHQSPFCITTMTDTLHFPRFLFLITTCSMRLIEYMN